MGGAVTPAHPATGSTAGPSEQQPVTPSKEAGAERAGKAKGKAQRPAAAPAASAAEGGGAAADAAAGDPEGVQALLDQSGFITRLSDVCYGIPQGALLHEALEARVLGAGLQQCWCSGPSLRIASPHPSSHPQAT